MVCFLSSLLNRGKDRRLLYSYFESPFQPPSRQNLGIPQMGDTCLIDPHPTVILFLSRPLAGSLCQMIEVVQTGQAGKTKLLFDMHRLRKRVFADRMKWPVTIVSNDLEIDQFDLPETVYLLCLNKDGKVVGNWRLLATTGPTMIRDVWPEFLFTLPMPTDQFVWEASRFAVESNTEEPEERVRQLNEFTAELFCALTELSILCGIREIYTLYDMRIARLLKRLDCEPVYVSEKRKIGDYLVQTGVFRTDADMLSRIQKKTGLRGYLINQDDLPPLLDNLRHANTYRTLREGNTSYARQ